MPPRALPMPLPRMMRRLSRLAWGLALPAALAGCLAPVPAEPPPAPPAPPPVVAAPVATAPSAASTALATYYRRLQNDLLAQGLMRSDDGEGDYPVTAENLARNFTRIALFDEYGVTASGGLSANGRISPLRRWDVPLRIRTHFGEATPVAQQARDTASLAAFADRLRSATGHAVTRTEGDDANLHVMFLSEDERPAALAQIRRLTPGIAPSSLAALRDMPRGTMCMTVAMTPPAGYGYIAAVILIRSELPDALRLACIHEELAQAMGLANDHPQVRPSIFNDDAEFALLTRHDRLLLQMLYDARLHPGMTAAEAAPVAYDIAQDLIAPPLAAAQAVSGPIPALAPL